MGFLVTVHKLTIQLYKHLIIQNNLFLQISNDVQTEILSRINSNK